MTIGVKKIKVKIDGRDFSKIVPSDFISLSLSQSVEQPHSLVMVFSREAFDKSAELAKSSIGFLGKKIDLTVRTDTSELTHKDEELKFSGIIVGINASIKNGFSDDSVVITASSPEIEMDDGSNTKAFLEKSVKDIVEYVIGEYNLKCPVSVSPENTGTHAYIVQYDESSYEFLTRLSKKYGNWFYYDGSKLTFGKAEKKEQIKLDVGKNLYDFQLKLNLQPFKFGMVAYDYADDGSQKYESKDVSQKLAQSKKGKKVESSSNQFFTHESNTFYNHPLTKGNQQAHLDKRVKIKKSGKGSNMVFCNGQSDCPLLKPGVVARINEKTEAGNVNHGSFLIVGVEHSLNRTGEYFNRFTGVPEDIEFPFHSNPHQKPYSETQSAIVVDNEDPDNFGRIRVRFFWMEDDQMTPWIRIANPYAGQEKGHMFIPEIDEEVLVAFEGGNAEKPYVAGSMYHAKAYPESWKPKNNDIKAIRTRSGHTIEFHDTDGEEEVWLYDYNKENYFIKLKTHAQEITIEAIEHIELKSKNISILAEKDLKIEATDATTKAGGNVSTEASGNISNKASGNMSNEASANMKVKGGANTTIEAGAKLEEKAAVVKLN